MTLVQQLTANSPGVPGLAEAGDHVGASVSTGNLDDDAVAVGVPGEASGKLEGTGTVDVFTTHQFTGKPSRFAAYTQNSAGVPGADEAGDHLGQQVAIVAGQLCAGVPGEDIGAVRDAGRVVCTHRVTDRGTPRGSWLSFQQGGHGRTSLGGSPTAVSNGPAFRD